MRRKIMDCKNRCACFVDDQTGVVEHEYRKVKTKTKVPIGGEYTIERDNTITILRRTAVSGFDISRLYVKNNELTM